MPRPRPLTDPLTDPTEAPPKVTRWPTQQPAGQPAQQPPVAALPPRPLPAAPPKPAQPPTIAPPIGAVGQSMPPPTIGASTPGLGPTVAPVFGGSGKVADAVAPIRVQPPSVKTPNATDAFDVENIDPDTGFVARKAGRDEAMQDFSPVNSVERPSDFVGFSEFAGLNDDVMRQIADRAASNSTKVRETAASFLKKAKGEATADTPVEKTKSYSHYLDAIARASRDSDSAVMATGNPLEDSLRGIYRGAQNARDDRLGDNLARSSGLSVAQRNTFLTDQRALAERRAADEAKRVAEAKRAAERAGTKEEVKREVAESRRDQLESRRGEGRGRSGRDRDLNGRDN